MHDTASYDIIVKKTKKNIILLSKYNFYIFGLKKLFKNNCINP